MRARPAYGLNAYLVPIWGIWLVLNTVRIPTDDRRLRLLRYLGDILGMRLMAQAEQSRDGSLEQ